MTETILTTCPRDCYDACGIAVVKENGSIKHVRGDPAHPVSRGRLCPKCSIGYNGAFRDPEKRLLTPQRRVGPKGAGEFEPVSWDTAIDDVASRLSTIAEEAGPDAILNTHYTGTLSLLAYAFPLRFFNRLGATEVDPDTVCNKAGHVALDYVYGTSETGFDPRTARDSACIVVWGANPSASAPHADWHWLPESHARIIVVDPIRTGTAEQAEIHLQPFPGSDAALAFALLAATRRQGLLDRAFLDAHAVGWDELEPLLDDCTPEWSETVTGVPSESIEEAATLYARGPSLLWLGQGLQRQRTGGNVMRACSILPVATGNLGKPGTGFLYLNGTDSRGIDFDELTKPELASDPPPPVSHMDLAARLEDTDRSRALVAWNINIAASNPDQERLHQALAREDLFTVVIDIFPTDTVRYADVVLPAASFLEFDDLVASYFNLSLSAQVKAAEPLGESLPNQEIFRRLARAMGFVEPELYETDSDVIGRILRGTGVGLGFHELAVGEPFRSGMSRSSSSRISRSRRGAAGSRSHRIEPRSTASPARRSRLPTHGRARPSTARHPGVVVAPQRQLCERREDLSPSGRRDGGAAPGRCGGSRPRRRKRCAPRERNGSLRLRLELSDALPRGVALSHKGRWPGSEPTGANVNVLNPGEKADMGESTAVHGVEVTVSAVPA